MVQILLGLDDVNPDKPNINVRAPIYIAAWNRREGVVKILLRQGDVNPNRVNKDGKALLDHAIEEGHPGVMTLQQLLASTAPSPA